MQNMSPVIANITTFNTSSAASISAGGGVAAKAGKKRGTAYLQAIFFFPVSVLYNYVVKRAQTLKQSSVPHTASKADTPVTHRVQE